MSSWTNGYWSQDDSIFYGLPLTNTSGMAPHEPDFSSGYYFYWYYPEESGHLPIPKSVTWINDVDISWLKLVFSNNDKAYGLPIPTFSPTPINNGSFKGCSNLSTIKIPATVKFIDYYSFNDTGLQSVQIAPDCRYYNNTFPHGCTVTHYPATIDRIELNGEAQDFIVCYIDQPVSAIFNINRYIPVIRIVDGGKVVERYITDFTVSGLDTSQEAEGLSGVITFKSCDNQTTLTKTFTYDVTQPPVSLGGLLGSDGGDSDEPDPDNTEGSFINVSPILIP